MRYSASLRLKEHLKNNKIKLYSTLGTDHTQDRRRLTERWAFFVCGVPVPHCSRDPLTLFKKAHRQGARSPVKRRTPAPEASTRCETIHAARQAIHFHITNATQSRQQPSVATQQFQPQRRPQPVTLCNTPDTPLIPPPLKLSPHPVDTPCTYSNHGLMK